MLKEYTGLKLMNEHGDCIKIMNEEDKFFTNVFNDLDMDSSFEVQKLAINFRKWAEWNKGKVIIDVYQSYELDVIVVIHNIFDEIKIGDSWEFLATVLYVLQLYPQTNEDWEYMIDFWCKKTI